MPALLGHARKRGLEALKGNGGVIGAAGREVEPDTANAHFAHHAKVAVGGLVIDDRHAASIGAARLHAEKRRGIVGAVDARRHDDDALDVQGAMQRGLLLRRDAAGEERELLRIAKICV